MAQIAREEHFTKERQGTRSQGFTFFESLLRKHCLPYFKSCLHKNSSNKLFEEGRQETLILNSGFAGYQPPGEWCHVTHSTLAIWFSLTRQEQGPQFDYSRAQKCPGPAVLFGHLFLPSTNQDLILLCLWFHWNLFQLPFATGEGIIINIKHKTTPKKGMGPSFSTVHSGRKL